MRTYALALAGIALLATGAAVVGIVATRPPSAPAIGNTDPTAVTFVVNRSPNGVDRVSAGVGFEEYQAAIATLPPLPASAEWPAGVPTGVDPGETADGGFMEAGGGVTAANFTWLCAWEYEYLDAVAVDDQPRVTASADALLGWAESTFAATWDPDHLWYDQVLGPIRSADAGGVRRDLQSSCTQAGIYNVRPPSAARGEDSSLIG